jgi:hypothetical protein
VLARVALVGGVALVASLVARSAPHEQAIVIRLPDRPIERVNVAITQEGDAEPTAGFSRDFPNGAPRSVRHTFSVPNAAYIVVISLQGAARGAEGGPPRGAKTEPAAEVPLETATKDPIPSETTFERRVSLVGGEVIVSPD